jgi:hypothetical protein
MMRDANSKLQRLLRSAAQTANPDPAEVPFGFQTRVVALWRADNPNAGGNGLGRLVRRVVVLAGFIILISGAASFRELLETRDIVEPGANEFAIADSAIQNEFDQ